jgi:para-aminobenzoate synthetase/4-amino-4-deoxychorismate lyase
VHVTDRIDTPFVDGPNATDPGRPIRLGIAHQRVNSSNAMLFHKTTHRAVYETAAYSIPTADDVLLVSENGHVTESTIANIAVRFGSEWRTPPLSSGCLPGVYRQVLVAEGKLREQAITLDDLSMGDEISLINSVRGWRVAHLLDG